MATIKDKLLEAVDTKNAKLASKVVDHCRLHRLMTYNDIVKLIKENRPDFEVTDWEDLMSEADEKGY